MNLPPLLWWPVGAVLISGTAFGWLYFFAVYDRDTKVNWLNWAAHWALMSLYTSITALVICTWIWLGP